MGRQKKAGNTFTKSERLNSKNKIDLLFTSGSSRHTGCIQMIYRVIEETSETPVQVMFSVSKKQFKNAVQRNLLKRRMREAYRLNKKTIVEVFRKSGKQLTVAFLFTGNNEEPYKVIEQNINQLLLKVAASFSKEFQ